MAGLIIAGVFCALMAALSLVRHIQAQCSSDRYPGSIRGPVPTVERRPARNSEIIVGQRHYRACAR